MTSLVQLFHRIHCTVFCLRRSTPCSGVGRCKRGPVVPYSSLGGLVDVLQLLLLVLQLLLVHLPHALHLQLRAHVHLRGGAQRAMVTCGACACTADLMTLQNVDYGASV